uniref:Caprin-1_dimer domain-containing protein n=1 Tax=Rhabditophanes sp. KR3021 TaxID=114890 RepID=A0AC35TM36_9BILA
MVFVNGVAVLKKQIVSVEGSNAIYMSKYNAIKERLDESAEKLLIKDREMHLVKEENLELRQEVEEFENMQALQDQTTDLSNAVSVSNNNDIVSECNDMDSDFNNFMSNYKATIKDITEKLRQEVEEFENMQALQICDIVIIEILIKSNTTSKEESGSKSMGTSYHGSISASNSNSNLALKSVGSVPSQPAPSPMNVATQDSNSMSYNSQISQQGSKNPQLSGFNNHPQNAPCQSKPRQSTSIQ